MLLGMKIEHKLDQRTVHLRNLARHGGKTRARQFGGGFEIQST